MGPLKADTRAELYVREIYGQNPVKEGAGLPLVKNGKKEDCVEDDALQCISEDFCRTDGIFLGKDCPLKETLYHWPTVPLKRAHCSDLGQVI